MVCKEDCPCLHGSSALTVWNDEAPLLPSVLVVHWSGGPTFTMWLSVLYMLQAVFTPENCGRFSGVFIKLYGNWAGIEWDYLPSQERQFNLLLDKTDVLQTDRITLTEPGYLVFLCLHSRFLFLSHFLILSVHFTWLCHSYSEKAYQVLAKRSRKETAHPWIDTAFILATTLTLISPWQCVSCYSCVLFHSVWVVSILSNNDVWHFAVCLIHTH